MSVSQPEPVPTFQKNPEQIARVERALNEKGANKACARCGTNGWHVDFVGILVTPLPATGGFQIPPPHIPAVVLTCHNCGNLVIHHAGLLGVEL